MPAITLKSIRGTSGEVTVPSLGLLIATMYQWSLTRLEEHGPRSGAFVLRAAFSYLNPMFQTYWNETSMRKLMVVKVGRNGPQYHVQVDENTKTTLADQQIVLEGVKLWQPEEQQT